MGALLQLKNLRKEFGSHLVLDDISLNFSQGSATVVIGASGSGKSTLMRCVNLLEELSDGQIILDGEDISTYGIDLDLVRGKIGSVFQAFNLFPHLTVLENITLAPRLVQKKSKAEAEARAHELLKRFGLEDKADRLPSEISGGEQQRVAIARAYVTKPPIIIADEPTGNLDPELSVGIMKLLDRINREGTTVLMATHDSGIVDQMRKRVIELDGGHVIRDQVRGVYGYTG
jgi:ABC-type polar amino acid transport system ATPase subunit